MKNNQEVYNINPEFSFGKVPKRAMSPQMKSKTALSPPMRPKNDKMKQIEEIYKKLDLAEHKTPQPLKLMSPIRVNDLKLMKSYEMEKPSNKYITESKAEKLIASIFKKK